MAKGRFIIKGTKDFLVAAVFCGFLCIWAISDAWFPSAKVLKKHPLEVPVAFTVHGVVKEIPVKVGQEINGEVVLATLYEDTHRTKLAEAEAAFEAAKAAKDPSVESQLEALIQAKKDLEACTLKNTDILRTTSHGEEKLRGTVVRILAEPSTVVEPGVPVLTIKPVDSFYAFNKTLTVLAFIGTIASLIFHRIAS